MKTVICSGSFDPVTVGHIDIITRASKMFDKIIVAVLHNMNKQACFTAEERVRLLEKATSDLPNVEVTSFDGLLADFAAQKNGSKNRKGIKAGDRKFVSCKAQTDIRSTSPGFCPVRRDPLALRSAHSLSHSRKGNGNYGFWRSDRTGILRKTG